MITFGFNLFFIEACADSEIFFQGGGEVRRLFEFAWGRWGERHVIL